MDKILFTGTWKKQCRTQHRTGDSRRFKVYLPLVHCNNTTYITANHLVISSKAGKSCTETTALSRRNLLCPGPLVGTERYLESRHKPNLPCSLEAAQKRGRTFPFLSSPWYTYKSQDSKSNSLCSFTLAYAFVTPPHGVPWDLAGSSLSYSSPQNCQSPVKHR